MGKIALVAVVLIAGSAGAWLWQQTAWGAREVTFEIGTFDREALPVVNSEGQILLVRSTGPRLEIFRLRRWPKAVVLATEQDVGGFIDRVMVATSPSGAAGKTLLIIKTCPGRPGVPDHEGGRGCPADATLRHFAYELGPSGGISRAPVVLANEFEAWAQPQPFDNGFVMVRGTAPANLPLIHPNVSYEAAIYRKGA